MHACIQIHHSVNQCFLQYVYLLYMLSASSHREGIPHFLVVHKIHHTSYCSIWWGHSSENSLILLDMKLCFLLGVFIARQLLHTHTSVFKAFTMHNFGEMWYILAKVRCIKYNDGVFLPVLPEFILKAIFFLVNCCYELNETDQWVL